MNIQIHLITLAISFIILYLSYKTSSNQDKLNNKYTGLNYGSKGYLCGTCEAGKTILITSPTNTYFTKFIFADYGNPGTCPSDVGPENLPFKSNNCTLPNTLPNSPFTYLLDSINGKTTIIVSATPDFFGVNLTCGSVFTYVLEYIYSL